MTSASLNHGPRTMSIGGATFDLFVRTGSAGSEGNGMLSFPVGAKVKVEQIIETCGGGGTNTAIGLSRLGCRAAFCGVVGGDQWGGRMLENLKENDVDVTPATVVEHETSSSSIILSVASGERIVLYNAGTNIHLHDVTFDRDAAAKADWLYLTHIQQPGTVIFNDLIAILSQPKHPGLTWNPGSTQIAKGIKDKEIAALLGKTTILLLNKEEALAFAVVKSVDEALAAFRRTGVERVCITDGADGAWAADAAGSYRCPPVPRARIVDTTGAGDAFGTGVTWATLRGEDLPNALRTGTILATSVLGAFGAQAGLLTHTQMQTQLERTPLPVETLGHR